MRKTQKTIVCATCGMSVSAPTIYEVIREEMDHYRLYHPDFYDDLLSEISLKQLYRWLLTQIERNPARI